MEKLSFSEDSNGKKPVVMQIIPELGQGGAEQGCIDVASALMKEGAQAIVVSNGGFRIHELQRFGATHINLPVHSKNPLVMAGNVGRLRSIINSHGVDVVHARSRAPAWSAFKACKGTNAHFMTTCHAPYNIANNTKRFYNSSIARGERVIAISDFVANYLLENYEINQERIRVIPRGIAIERFHPTAVTPERLIALTKEWRIPDASSVIMMPGRLTRWKGHHVVIDALKILNRSDAFCVFLGSDQGRVAYRQELEDYICEKGLGSKVRIVDHCNDMPAAYMLATVVLSASTDPEGFGRVPVESQAMGRPTVATDHGGAQETIVKGDTGWLVPPGNASAMAGAISEALSLEPMQRAILATRAMSHIAQNFTSVQMAEKTLSLYRELIGMRKPEIL